MLYSFAWVSMIFFHGVMITLLFDPSTSYKTLQVQPALLFRPENPSKISPESIDYVFRDLKFSSSKFILYTGMLFLENSHRKIQLPEMINPGAFIALNMDEQIFTIISRLFVSSQHIRFWITYQTKHVSNGYSLLDST